ncbi:interleukin-1 beta, partial [Fundulus heteroclitus]|uniref:interleukin-1 beta n=1 Tax=Fundulus heteroclitus TaxID=8078 RepID=UPI00165A2867
RCLTNIFDVFFFAISSAEYTFPFSDLEDVRTEIFELSSDLDLRVTHNRKTMKSVANLVLAANRLKKSLSQFDSDYELCSAIMDCVVEETVFHKCWNSFQRFSCWKQLTLCDKNQKDFILNLKRSKLQAVILKGGYGDCKVSFEMTSYGPPPNSSADCMVVLLSVTKDLHMSCSKTDDKVLLNLEECSEERLKEISKEEDMVRFLFNKRGMVSLYTFESVKYPGWFISTSSEDSDQSVEMCQIDAASRVTSFKVLS